MHLTANTGSKVEITKDGVKYLFRVMGCGDQAHGLVKPHTVLYTEGEPFDDEDPNDFDNKRYWFDQIVGCEKAKSQIKNLAECYLDGKKI